MNILLSLKKFSHIGYYIHEARTKAKERKKHLLTGVYKPTEGIIKLDGQDITGKSTIEIA